MHRTDNTRFLLYIEPKAEDKSEEPVEDEYVEIMEQALSEAKVGTANYDDLNNKPSFEEGGGYIGFHTTDCDVKSDNHDYLLKNGMVTNSLAPFYLRHYRDFIPYRELIKVKELVEFYKNNDGDDEKRLNKWMQMGFVVEDDVTDDGRGYKLANMFEGLALMLLNQEHSTKEIHKYWEETANILLFPAVRYFFNEYGIEDYRDVANEFFNWVEMEEPDQMKSDKEIYDEFADHYKDTLKSN